MLALVGLLLREQFDLGPCCLQYNIPKYKGRFFFLFFIFPFLGQKSTGINNDVLSFYYFNFRILALENIGKKILTTGPRLHMTLL